MKEIQHFKVKVLPNKPQANSVYFVAADGATSVTTYITDKCGIPLPLVDLKGTNNVTGTGVTGTQQDPVVNISTFLSSESGNLITLSTIDGKLYLESDQDNKVVYFYPTLLELGVTTIAEVTNTHIATWIQTRGIVISNNEIPFFKVQLTLYPIYFDNTGDDTFNPTVFYATKDYTTTNAIGATVYVDKAGSQLFNVAGIYTRSISPNMCTYTINNNGLITSAGCRA